jgi:hypothetical protein
MGQHEQFQEVMEALKVAKDKLDPARQVSIVHSVLRPNMNILQVA